MSAWREEAAGAVGAVSEEQVEKMQQAIKHAAPPQKQQLPPKNNSRQHVVETAGHAHAEAEEQVSKVVEVPGRRVSQPKSGVDFKISNLAQPQKPQTRRREECSVPSPAV